MTLEAPPDRELDRLSHELRTGATLVAGCAELLLERPWQRPGLAELELLDAVERGAERLLAAARGVRSRTAR